VDCGLSQSALVSSVIDSLGDGLLVVNAGGRVLLANRVARELFGNNGSELGSQQWPDGFGLYVPGTDMPFPSDQLPLTQVGRGDECRQPTEVVVRNHTTSDDVLVSVCGCPLSFEGAREDGTIIIFRDLTTHKRSEELLERLSAAVQQTADAVLITDRTGVIEYVNPAFERTTGYSSAEAVGQTPRVLRSGRQSPAYYDLLWSTILKGEPFHGSPTNRRKDGTLYDAEQTITPIRGSSGEITHFVSLIRDMTERNRIEEQEIEMRLAASIQRRLFPQEPPQLDGYEIAGVVRPALQTCGDYYDFISTPGGEMVFTVADVCGHGLGPAFIMGQARAGLRYLLGSGLELDRVLFELNRILVSDLDEKLYVTMSVVRLNPASGTLAWVNGGHPSGYLLDASGSVKTEVSSTGLPLGMLPDRPYALGDGATIDPGDVLLLLTDGLLEAQNPAGAEFGIERVLAVASQHVGLPAQEILDRILDARSQFVGGAPQQDDVTVVVCRRLPLV